MRTATAPTPTPTTAGIVTGVLPGAALCAVGAAAAFGVHALLPGLSPMLVAIVLGAVFTNVVDLPQRVRPGVDFSARRLLRLGIVLLGLQLLMSDILGLGWQVIVTVVAVVVLGIIVSLYIGGRLGLSWTQRVLIACGFSICGAAAVAAVNGVVDADQDEVLTAVALVVVFGTLMIPAVPLLSHALGLSDTAAGLWAGGSIHEVAQVVAAGGLIGGGALAVAAVAKLARVLMLAPVIAVLGVHRRLTDTATDGTRPPLVPLFVVGFIGCVALRSTGIVPARVLDVASTAQTVLLSSAMFALGAGVRIATITKVGPRPFVLAALSTVWVAAVALVGVVLSGS